MAAFSVVVNALGVEKVGQNLGKINAELLGRASVSAVNEVAVRAFDESRRRMLSRVNLTPDYVRERMDLEPANDSPRPTATIIAFRAGGRRKAVRPVNLRQYRPLYEVKPARQNPTDRKTFTMRDGRVATYPVTPNPRNRSKRLPFVLRTGSPALGIPVGQKPGQLSVEVLKGQRKVIKPKGRFSAFLQTMPSGETLVMRRTNVNGGKSKKGSIEALYSLSVWQLFRNAAAEVVPLVRKDLENTVGDAVTDAVNKAFAA